MQHHVHPGPAIGHKGESISKTQKQSKVVRNCSIFFPVEEPSFSNELKAFNKTKFLVAHYLTLLPWAISKPPCYGLSGGRIQGQGGIFPVDELASLWVIGYPDKGVQEGCIYLAVHMGTDGP